MSHPVVLDGHSLDLNQVQALLQGAPIRLAAEARRRVDSGRALVEKVVDQHRPVYGINTGFGYFARRCVEREKLCELQLNLLKSHASGWGNPLEEGESRLAVALRLNVLLKGLTGVRWELCRHMVNLLDAGIVPLIPEHGSVGASGDLAPLAHLALPLVGLGKVRYQGKIMDSKKALKAAGLSPITLLEKEGLGLINGTQVMLAVGGAALILGLQMMDFAERVAALSFEAMEAHPHVLDSQLHRARGQVGQMESAKLLRAHLRGSYLHRYKRFPKVQDAYSLRCVPQVHGPSRDALSHARSVIERELNAATDNPLVFADRSRVISGGNFHGQALAMAFDIASIALAEIGNLSERRLEQLFNPHFSGLPAFLSPEEGLQSGYMAAQYLSASLVNENKLLANPACTDSIPGNVGVEDHVSMGMTCARKLKRLVHHLKTILVVEALGACQAIDMKSKTRLGQGTAPLYDWVRGFVPPLKEDRVVADDVQTLLENFSTFPT